MRAQRTFPALRGRLILAAAFAAAALLCSGCAARKATSRAAPSKGTPQDTTAVRERIDSAGIDHATAPGQKPLSSASQLMIKACDNYLAINPSSPKSGEVLTIKGSIYYNNRHFARAREIYAQLIDSFPGTGNATEAVRMTAQAFYEEKRFDEAQEWFRKLRDMAGEGGDKEEAIARIAESIFRMAEALEEQSRFKDAAAQYERVALEFPEAKIADVSLFNAGLAYEKQTEWSHAILLFQRMLQRYPQSKLQPKAMFRIAKSHEKLSQWDNAAEMYLRVTAGFPRSDLAPLSLYNAGFCFENAEKLPEAAATFEKMAQLYPATEDAADVLFRAGEIYGKLKDWESVTRVNQAFSMRYGSDADRAIQALCMVGIALYMQNQEAEAIEQLKKAVATFTRIKEPSTANAFYAAKAQYTIGEITHGMMGRVALGQPRSQYRKQLGQKSDLLDRTVEAYGKAVKFNISEWTTRAVFQIGQAYEDFALGVFRQERAPEMSIDERLALELGIAQAVEKYFVEKALHYHEQNTKLGIQNPKLEDKYILQSRRKLTYLPFVAAENYLTLSEIAKNAEAKPGLDGFALIARKLQVLQKIGPYQERAIDLLLKSLEVGTTYQEQDEFYRKASSLITRISFSVAQTYADVVTIAREAPIPDNFDDYERFVYKSKLLKQIEGYEDQAITNYLKTLKIADAYTIEDESVASTRDRLAQLLFNRGRCYDLLCTSAFRNPPFPHDIGEAEKEEYRARFEEIGLRLQEQAFEIYRNILEFGKSGNATGEYVTHAFVRLYQNFPEEFGVKEEKVVETGIPSGPQWKCSPDSAAGWTELVYNDSAWARAQKARPGSAVPKEFPGKSRIAMWFGSGNSDDSAAYKPFGTVYFRRPFQVPEMPHSARLFLLGDGEQQVYLNARKLAADSAAGNHGLRTWNLLGNLREGENVIAIRAAAREGGHYGVLPYVKVEVTAQVFSALPPGSTSALTPEEVREDIYRFPHIKNFSPEEKEAKR